MSALIGKKIGMTGIYSEQGVYIPCTLIELGPCKVMQVKTIANDGYEALQLGFGTKKESRATKADIGHASKSGDGLANLIKEVRSFDISSYKTGDVINVGDIFSKGEKVHITCDSKGRGFQGVMKRHHFRGVGMQTHGQSDRQRHPGSIGGSSYPSRVFPGTRMAGRMGGKKTTVRNLEVVELLSDKNIVVIKGSIPGAPQAYVEVRKS